MNSIFSVLLSYIIVIGCLHPIRISLANRFKYYALSGKINKDKKLKLLNAAYFFLDGFVISALVFSLAIWLQKII